MHTISIKEIFAANDIADQRLRDLLAEISDDESRKRPDGEKWSIAEIVEHMALVEDGMARICAKLLSGAEPAGDGLRGAAVISENYVTKGRELLVAKVEAPERVHPTGELPIADSLAVMDAGRNKLKELMPLFEELDCDSMKFPHPYMGGISAAEWLSLEGEHKKRHTRQIKRVLEGLRT